MYSDIYIYIHQYIYIYIDISPQTEPASKRFLLASKKFGPRPASLARLPAGWLAGSGFVSRVPRLGCWLAAWLAGTQKILVVLFCLGSTLRYHDFYIYIYIYIQTMIST